MGIHIKFSAIKQTKWYEYAIRFIFGGLITAFTGIITAKYGPVIGGLFLAFPSIYPASLTLAQSHKQKENQQMGQDKEESREEAKNTAADTATGTSLGSLGLIFFGLVIWKFSESLAPWVVLLFALAAWFGTALLVWWLVIGKNRNSQDNSSK